MNLISSDGEKTYLRPTFEYDNISLVEIGILELSQNGKLGFCKFNRDEEHSPFYIQAKTACKYDVIKYHVWGYIIAYKQLGNDNNSCKIFFLRTNTFSDIGEFAFKIDHEFVALIKDERTYIYNANTGKIVTKLNYQLLMNSSFQSEYGIILLLQSAKLNNSVDILLFDTVPNVWYELDNKCNKYLSFNYDILDTHHAIQVPCDIDEIYPIPDIRAGEYDRKIISGFLIKTPNGFTVLDGKLDSCGIINCESVELGLHILTNSQIAITQTKTVEELDDLFRCT